jgi:glycosyltransferase involved in cell wall biosynthesis
MNIVIDGRMILPEMTGVGRYIIELAQALRDLPGQDNFELWLQSRLPADHPAWRLEGEHLSVRRLPLAHMELRQQWILPAELRRTHPDLFHYPHFDLPAGVPGKVIANIHDLKYIARPEFFPQTRRKKRLVMLGMMVFTVRRASRVIAVSENARQDIIRRLGALPANVRVIYHAVNDRYFSLPDPGSMEDLCQRYRLENPFILFVGERRPHKNITGLILAYNIFRRMTQRPFELVIAGKPYASYQEPERLVEQLGLNGKVRFVDYIPDEDLPLFYQRAEVFSLLSYYEGFGLPVLEAMASGTPVVCAGVTSLPEVCGQAGLLVDPTNPEQAALAIAQVITGGMHREELIMRGKTRARQFTWEKCAAQTVELYHEAAAA